MPHGPYLTLEKKTTQTKDQYFELYNEQAYLSHVRYTDSVILDLFHAGLDSLSPDQRTNTMVILQSDHGPRYLQKGEKDLRWRSSFGILNAVLWPKYSNGKFYNGMSSVNTFRILLRDYWGIDLGTVKDSSENVSPLIESKNE
jgi:membrane-anchored protein YejM (alkaline phosphatase superfamily)